MKIKFNNKEKQLLAILIGVWGIILLSSGISLNKTNNKEITKKNYTLKVEKRKIPQSQAKINEIKLKDITIEINNPISVNVRDYLENPDQIEEKVLKKLVLDTSLVNINQAGNYQYTIKYNKKKYNATISVKQKELPNVEFTLKNLSFDVGTTLSTNPRSYINETISDEVYNAITLDLSQVAPNIAGTYVYYITYKNTTYSGQITMKAPGPTVKAPNPTPTPTPTPTETPKE